MRSFRLRMKITPIKLYTLLATLMTSIPVSGHSCEGKMKLKVVFTSSYKIEFKLCMTVTLLYGNDHELNALSNFYLLSEGND